MSLYTYRHWQIFLIPCRKGWQFRVFASETKEDPLSDRCVYQTLETALVYAQQFVDFQIDCQDLQRRIFAALDAKLERDEIDPGLYIQIVRFMRDGLLCD